jgi:putative membrane protein
MDLIMKLVNLFRKSSTLLLGLYTVIVTYVVLSFFLGIEYRPFLTPLSTLILFVFAVDHGSQRLGWKRALLLLSCTFVVSLVFESVGVATGWIYGAYHYTDKLGPKFLGLVPLLIPIAWFMMSYPSFIIANRLVPRMKDVWTWRLAVAATGAVVMTAWDLAMDPMMVAGEHWIWDQPGAYFGIPLQNYWGWWVTIFVTFWLFLTLARLTPTELTTNDPAFERQPVLGYAIAGLSTVIVCLEIGLTGPALVGLAGMAPWVLGGLWNIADSRRLTDRSRMAADKM